MGTMIPFYILAFLFLALMGFAYLSNRLFLKQIRYLVKVVSNLKAFSMGKLSEEKEIYEEPKSVKIPDEDFGDLREEPEEEEGEPTF